MRLALHIDDYSGFGAPGELGPVLARVAETAEAAGFARLSVPDRLWPAGDASAPMPESYTTLGFVAARTRTIELQTLVTAATYRPPGLLAKTVSTLDALSGGRAWLGIGPGRNGREAAGLGLPFGPAGERFDRLEETVQICRQMWSVNRDPFVGEYYRLGSTFDSPRPVSRPRPRILIGGDEEEALRLAAVYADAFNVRTGRDARHRIDRLRAHCAEAGRDPDAVETTGVLPHPADGRGDAERLLKELWRLNESGFGTVYLIVPEAAALTPLETIGAKVISEIAAW
ncbi:LLM class F420-dependent oxidoreductase [Actinomadura sp. CNU-125]|uniref:LLM class flavin-dependent oxidoreductase n=1 Tax=Actinomadura sp. CNU-125 TaxID=1904961 RepID=UPI0009688854|nr:LLM class flavin-dependent oxidoreductase [Actinomadura sp. CNU-125]OLT12158.1 LLM class F420-dependent oxidoreductase [Actinomadura sp. CNU-125]